MRARAVSAAKVCVGRACRIVGQGAMQIHGGMGMTEELAVGHYFRRATQIEHQTGSVDHHLRRVDRLSTGCRPAFGRVSGVSASCMRQVCSV